VVLAYLSFLSVGNEPHTGKKQWHVVLAYLSFLSVGNEPHTGKKQFITLKKWVQRSHNDTNIHADYKTLACDSVIKAASAFSQTLCTHWSAAKLTPATRSCIGA
jgi:hypothetical protein